MAFSSFKKDSIISYRIMSILIRIYLSHEKNTSRFSGLKKLNKRCSRDHKSSASALGQDRGEDRIIKYNDGVEDN